LDKQKNLCSGTSTGGFRSALPGRIGDSCIIGAGTYCNNVCAVSLTGRGESIVKLSMGKRIVDLVQFEKCLPQIAVQRALKEFKVPFSDGKYTMGAIAVDLQGNIGIGFKGAYMAWCALIESENQYILRFGAKEKEIIEKQLENPMF